MSNIFMSTENSKISDPNIFRLYFTVKIDLRGNKKIALSDLSTHYTWYNIKEQYNSTITINLDCQDQLGLKMLLYLMVVMKYLKYKMLSLMNSHQF